VLGFPLFLLTLLLLTVIWTCGGTYTTFVVLAALPILFLLLAPMLVAAGIMVIAVQMSSAISQIQHKSLWTDLLLLPYERSSLILYSLSGAYFPVISMIGMLLMGLIPILVLPGPILVLIPFIIIEWMQLQAFGVTVGLAGTLGRFSSPGRMITLSLSILGMILRAGFGWLMAAHDDRTVQYTSLILGPLVSLLAFPPVIGIIVVALYLLGLEALIRGLFTYAVNRAGEGIG
jgi:hypothetical protein